MTGRQHAAGPDKRKRRENVASPVQVGPPATLCRGWTKLCVTGPEPAVYAGGRPVPGPDSPGRRSGEGTLRFARQREEARGARSWRGH